MSIQPQKIDEQYIKLLEQSNVSLQKKSNIFSVKNALVYSGIFLFAFLVFAGYKTFFKTDIIFQGHLKQVAYAPDKLLIQYGRHYYQIPEHKDLKWLVADALMVHINNQKLQFVNLSDVRPVNQQTYKILVPENRHYQVVLSDGTKIMLNEQTQLSFVNNRNTQKNNAVLQGEAFFKVTHNDHKTFKIKAGDMTVEVYGTSFNITNYSQRNLTQVALVKGSVKVKTRRQSKFIVPGQQAVLKPDKTLEIKPANLSRITAWTDSSFYFKNKKLTEILSQLENRYQVQFIIKEPKIRDLKFTGKITRNDDLIQFLKMLEYTENIHYSIQNKQVILTKKQQ
jgi:ferric-dicitrate binding protein FerR (iron transport regulator)